VNPEFVRNVWLELTPRRIGFMLAILALVFFAAETGGREEARLFETARWLYYLFAVFWGTHSAALAVVGEIRERTWDLQRLSAIEPGAMTWGKLFGATIYNWFGALICLAVMTMSTLADGGVLRAFFGCVYFLLIGVIAQAGALLASLIAAERRQSHTRLEVAVYQLVGLAAALVVSMVWRAVEPAAHVEDSGPSVFPWWGLALGTRGFALVSIAMFTAWTLAACYRAMRIELRMRNGPQVWLAWLAFITVYVAGFDGLLRNERFIDTNVVSQRLGLALSVNAFLTYAMVLLEPKDRVLYRWLGAELRAGRVGSAVAHLQAWMMSYAACVLLAVLLIAWLAGQEGPALPMRAFLVAALGFLTRDVGIFVLMRTLAGQRGDVAALGTLLALYVLLPAILNGGGETVLSFFFPFPGGWLGAAIAWVEAAVVVIAASGRIAIERPAVSAAA
jgi:hypothetical protein